MGRELNAKKRTFLAERRANTEAMAFLDLLVSTISLAPAQTVVRGGESRVLVWPPVRGSFFQLAQRHES